MNKKERIKYLVVRYSTFAIIAGSVVLVDHIPGLKYDGNRNKFYVSINVEKKENNNIITPVLKSIDDFNEIKINIDNENIIIDPNTIDSIKYLDNNEIIIISFEKSTKYYIGIFDYQKQCYQYHKKVFNYSKNEINSYVNQLRLIGQ